MKFRTLTWDEKYTDKDRALKTFEISRNLIIMEPKSYRFISRGGI